MSNQAVQEWVDEIGTPLTGRVVLSAVLPISAAEPVLDDDKGRELGRLDELAESGRPLIVHVSGYMQVLAVKQTLEGAPVLHLEAHEGGSLAVDEILAR